MKGSLDQSGNWLLGLRARAVLVVLTLLLSLAMLALLVVQRANEALLDLDRARFFSATEQLADAASYGVLAKSAALLNDPLDAWVRSQDLVSVQIVDDTGAVLTERAGLRAGAKTTVRTRVDVWTKGQAPGTDDDDLAAFGVTTSAPKKIGAVIGAFASVSTAQIQRRTERAIVGAVGSVGAVAFIAVLWLVTSLVRRLRTLQHAAVRVRQGDLTVKVHDDGMDELSALTRDFNAMTASLDTQGKALAEREALAAIGRATAVIAHELRNPLGIVMGAAEIVDNDNKPLAARKQASGIIVQEVARLSATLDDLLAYARPRPPVPVDVSLRDVCERLIARAALPGGPAERIKVQVDIAPHTRVHVDSEQFAQVLWNLVQNAAQAGATQLALSSSAAAHVHVDIVDNGAGIDAALNDTLFLPFATSKQRGSGLGLALSRRMMRDAGGDLVRLPTETGAGFRITLARPLATNAKVG